MTAAEPTHRPTAPTSSGSTASPSPSPTSSTPPRARRARRTRADRAAIARSRLEAVLTHLLVILGVLLSVFAFYWLAVMSTSTSAEIFGYPPKLTFGSHFAENLRHLTSSIDIVSALVNTIVVAGACAVLVMFFDSLAAFAFAKFDFPGKNVLFVVMIATFLIPGSLSLVPSFILMSEIGWVGTLQALIVPGAANAFGIFLLRQMAASAIPNELIESARIDGAGFFSTYWRIGVPMLRGGLAFLGIFTFITAWNDYVWPLIVLVDPGRQTLQTALQNLNSLYLTDYGMVMTGALVSVLPLIGVFIIGSRHFIANIAAGALKG
ncbi:sugar ABC transporter permease [Brachybacterium endophyticum]|uniref:Sugar ABC transporter permease n=1 Tax=Brachybacterium endophyticum TaxID=2182385 RepID=A0A2U2RHR0_9MICO|nr:carbohydrate ABC transporter permease [Brachybacterium endophyticum]PWH05384.1 sugar ABC transporter permease [Brachybacterium endophyticum]